MTGGDEGWQREIAGLLRARSGHFRFESGHHGQLWLDLELLCLHPAPVRRLAEALAEALVKHAVDAVCGPLVEGAFVALFVASALGVPFSYTEPRVDGSSDGLFPVTYVLPAVLGPELRGRRVAIVNDVVNAGSAVRGTLAELRAHGAVPVVIGSLAVLGEAARRLTKEAGVAMEALATLPNEIWTPEACPLCARGEPLTTSGGGAGARRTARP